MAEELTPEKIGENAAGAESFTADGQSASAVPIADQIEAAKFARMNSVKAKKTPGGIRLARIISPGHG